MKEIFNLDNKNMFDELLDSISSAFEYWRYIYEKIMVLLISIFKIF